MSSEKIHNEDPNAPETSMELEYTYQYGNMLGSGRHTIPYPRQGLNEKQLHNIFEKAIKRHTGNVYNVKITSTRMVNNTPSPGPPEYINITTDPKKGVCVSRSKGIDIPDFDGDDLTDDDDY